MFSTMSAEIPTQLFLSEPQGTWLDEILQEKVAEAASSVPASASTGCLLTDIGDFLVRHTNILSHIANSVVYGQHINIYTKEKIREMGRDHDFSELSSLDYMNKKHTTLKSAHNARTATDLCS
jgi:hypothetical protein